jgi:hypothetical protein
MVNPDGVKQFGAKLLNIYTGGVLTNLIDIGYQTGLFEASKRGAATSAELSERAGVRERYVREWLGAMVTSGIYLRRHDAALHAARGTHRVPDRRYRAEPLPP